MRRALVLVFLVLPAALAQAVFLDPGRRVEFRARLYNESSVSTEGSQPQTSTPHFGGQLFSNRTFFNPELETDLNGWVPWVDEASFRLAIWGFYDGIYDYGTSQYNRARDRLGARFTEGVTSTAPITRTDTVRSSYQTYAYQRDPVMGAIPFRLNEMYLNLAKGPLSVRVGRQAISWGESDTIALLDQSNPFDLTRGVPGVFEDIDEARIPLFTLRTTLSLGRGYGPISSPFLDTYLVPGSIDTTVAQPPILTTSPYAPPESDPQELLDAFASIVPAALRPILFDKEIGLGGIRFVQYDHLPPRSMGNSRYGARLQAVLWRDYTTSLWFYRTFNQVPVPRFKPLDLTRAPLYHPDASGPAQIITETVHRPVNVFATSVSFFSQPLDAVIRAQGMYFLDEAAFLPNVNLPFQRLVRQPRLRKTIAQLGVQLPGGPDQGFVPKADFFRWELGYDRNFFVRALNPANSFIFVGAYVGSWNLSEAFTGKNYRYYGQRKPSATGLKTGVNVNQLPDSLKAIAKLHTVPGDFVDLKPVEHFVQGTLRTDYLHGRLTPQLTAIVNIRGTFALVPAVSYRWSDNVVFDFRYATLDGGFFQTGFFRDRDQVSARVTFLLN